MNSEQTGIETQSVRLWRLFDRGLDAIAAFCKLLTGVSLVFLTTIFGWLVFGR